MTHPFSPFRAQPLRLQSPIPNKHGRVPGAVPPNRAGAGIHLQEKWATSRSSSSHCEPSLRLQQQDAAPGQVLWVLRQTAESQRIFYLQIRSDNSGPRYISIIEGLGKKLHPHVPGLTAKTAYLAACCCFLLAASLVFAGACAHSPALPWLFPRGRLAQGPAVTPVDPRRSLSLHTSTPASQRPLY